ncbi:MAG: hypothetical protein AAFV53_14450, partial [Myxococcota bacterium]
WGYEDVELRFRCQITNTPIGRRDGVYRALPHPHNGVQSGQLTPIAKENRNRCIQKLQSLNANYQQDGLSTLDFRLERSVPLNGAGTATLHQVWI